MASIKRPHDGYGDYDGKRTRGGPLPDDHMGGQVHLRNMPMDAHYPPAPRGASGRGEDWEPDMYSRQAPPVDRQASSHSHASQYSSAYASSAAEYAYPYGGYPPPHGGYGYVSVRPPLVLSDGSAPPPPHHHHHHPRHTPPPPAYSGHPQQMPPAPAARHYSHQYSRELSDHSHGHGSPSRPLQHQRSIDYDYSMAAPQRSVSPTPASVHYTRVMSEPGQLPLRQPLPAREVVFEADPITIARRASMEYEDDDPGTPPPDIHGGFHLFPPGELPKWLQPTDAPAQEQDPNAPHKCSMYLPCLVCMNAAACKAEQEAAEEESGQ